MYALTTLTRFRRHLGLADSDTADDTRLLAALQAASTHIERGAGRRFCPRRAAIQHTIGLDRTELALEDDLLALESVTDAGGSIPLDAILLLPDTGGDEPVGILRLIGGRAFTWDESPFRAVTVTGLWGWHSQWTQAWESSGDTVSNNPLGSGATTLAVADADGASATGETPRFQIGQLLQIESEYLRVLAVNAAANQLTVERGVGGTTAASHAQTTPIAIFRPAPDVETLALRWATWLYKTPDVRPPTRAPEPLAATLDSLRRVRI